MTEPEEPRGKLTLHLSDGTPTEDRSKAATAEVNVVYPDGRRSSTFLVKEEPDETV